MTLEVKNLSFRYGKKDIFRDVSFTLGQGRMLALLGPNGTGKTTLLKALSGILKPWEGESCLEGEDLLKMPLKKKAKLTAYVPQNTNSSFPMRVVDAVMMGRKPFQRFGASKQDERVVFDLLEKMSLSALAFKNIQEISGGERQRVFIARALCQEPSLLLLDEPTSSMDLKNQLQTMAFIRNLADTKSLAVIVSIHDINLAAMYCDDFMFLRDGKIDAYGDAETVLTQQHIWKVYGVQNSVSVIDGHRHVILKKQ